MKLAQARDSAAGFDPLEFDRYTRFQELTRSLAEGVNDVSTVQQSLLKNLDKRLREETGLPLAMAEDPLSSVVLGAGKMLSDFNLLRKISID
mgnify:CR=1 FL=1